MSFMGNFDRKDGVLVPGMNDARPRRNQYQKVVPISIQTDPREDMVDRLNELRFELQCVEEAILTLESLVLSRFPKHRDRPPKVKSRLHASR
jgi:hypothetical protein